MNDFKKDYELRRNIFGLSSIVKTATLPDLVNSKLPEILNQLSLLASKMYAERQDTLKDNEEEV